MAALFSRARLSLALSAKATSCRPAQMRFLFEWSGKAPEQTPGFDPKTRVLNSLPLVDASKCTRQTLHEYFDNSWTLTEVLFKSLKTEDAFYRPPGHGLRHPKIFYYTHPAVVYINKLRVAGLVQGHINEHFERIFEVGVDEMRWDDMSKNHMKWPTIPECTEYRRQAYKTISDLINNHPAFETIASLQKSQFWAIILGFEHERIHFETSAVLIRELPLDVVQAPVNFPKVHPSAAKAGSVKDHPKEGTDFPKNEFLSVPAGQVHLGKPLDWPTFGWDNEYGSRDVNVPAFAANKFKITNGEFWHFVKGGGYLSQKYWSETGWAWRSFRNTKWPHFWVSNGPSGLHQYKLRNTFGLSEMPWNWPVIVNYHEAVAYANWKSEQEGLGISQPQSLRIMTELEQRRILDKSMLSGPKRDPVMQFGSEAMAQKGYNLNLAYGSESPVDAFPPASTGFHDVIGNVWEWCEDHFNALPGFKVHPYYDDFSLPCFDGEHNIIMGGSWISTGDEASVFARFHFRPHFHQFSGFRLVKPDSSSPTLLTSCMNNPGPFGAAKNPFRSYEGAAIAAAPAAAAASPCEGVAALFEGLGVLPSTLTIAAEHNLTTAAVLKDSTLDDLKSVGIKLGDCIRIKQKYPSA